MKRKIRNTFVKRIFIFFLAINMMLGMGAEAYATEENVINLADTEALYDEPTNEEGDISESLDNISPIEEAPVLADNNDDEDVQIAVDDIGGIEEEAELDNEADLNIDDQENAFETEEEDNEQEIIEEIEEEALNEIDSLEGTKGFFEVHTNTYINADRTITEHNNVISLWGDECKYTIEGKQLFYDVNDPVVKAKNNGTDIILTGGDKAGRRDIKTTDGTIYIIYNYESKEVFEFLYDMFHGKTVAVLGDSISALEYNIPYGNQPEYHLKTTPYNNMYWGDIITRFGAKQGTIEAWWASTIGSEYHAMCGWKRINRIGNGGQPDILLYYGGSNPDTKIKVFDKDADYAKAVDMEGKYPSTAEAYPASLNRIRMLYPDTLIVQIIPYCKRAAYQQDIIAEIAQHYNILAVDLRELKAREVVEPSNALHPNATGQKQIAEYICEGIYRNRDMIEAELDPLNRVITFDAETNGGECDITSAFATEIDIAEVIASKPALGFTGWFTQPEGGTRVTDATMVGFTTTLYAQFAECEHHHYSIRYVFTDDGVIERLYCLDCRELLSGDVYADRYSSTILGCEGSAVTADLLPKGWKWSSSNVVFPIAGTTIKLEAQYDGLDKNYYLDDEKVATLTLVGTEHDYKNADADNHICSVCNTSGHHNFVGNICTVCNHEDCRKTGNHCFIKPGEKFTGTCFECGMKCKHIANPEETDANLYWAIDEGRCTICGMALDVPTDDDSNVIIGEVPDSLWISGVSNQPYTGKKIEQPNMKVYWKYTLLEKGKDYTVKYSNNVKAGTATVTVTGKGNYAGTIKKTYTIKQLDISLADVLNDEITIRANGKEQKPSIVVTMEVGGKTITLKKGVDYRCVNSPIIEKGVYPVKIEGIGNFCNDKTITVNVVEGLIPATAITIADIPKQSYTGGEIKPNLSVSYKKTGLVEGTNYTVEYKNNTEIGTATATVTFKGEYTGKKSVTYKIVGVSISKAEAQINGNYIYTGEAIKPAPSEYKLYIKDKNTSLRTDLVENVHYKVTFENNIKAGTATAVFTGINEYSGVLTKTFKIRKASMLDMGRIHVDSIAPATYEKNGVKPSVTVRDGTKILTKDVDYTVSYANNKSIGYGRGEVIITGKGNYADRRWPEKFDILASSLDKVNITASDIVAQNKINTCKPSIVLTDVNGVKLKAGVDYYTTIEFTYKEFTKDVGRKINKKTTITLDRLPGSLVDPSDIIPAGTVISARVTGRGCYDGTKEVTFRYVGMNIKNVKVVIPNFVYTKNEIMPGGSDIQVTRVVNKGIVPLVYNQDFVIESYSNNVNKGIAQVVLKGIGNYGGTKVATFRIVAKTMNYKITFDKNSTKAFGTMNDMSIPSGTKLTRNTFLNSGKRFKCWCTKPNIDDPFAVTYADGEAFVKKGLSILSFGDEITLYAIWE